MKIYLIVEDYSNDPVGYVRTEEEANRICYEIEGLCWMDIDEINEMEL